jgi:hypothetical protein
MGFTAKESTDGLTIVLSLPVRPADTNLAHETIQNFSARHWAGKATCGCPVGVHEVCASADLYRVVGGQGEKHAVYYCASGCGRMSCVASEQGYAAHCCKSCAETSGHSVACDSNWPGMAARIIKRAVVVESGHVA